MCEPGRVFILGDYLQNKKTVIYGAGATGRKLYSQLVERGIDVVAVVDRNADSLDNTFFCPLITPESFFYNHFSQDFIFIANLSKLAKSEIREFLIEKGIKKEKILYLEENFYDGIQEYQMKDDPDVAFHQLVQANENIKGNVDLTEQFQIWMNVYYSNLTDKERFKDRVKDEFYNNSSKETRIMLGVYMFELNEFDATQMRHLVEYISELREKDYDWRYFLTIRIYGMELNQNKLLYKGLGAERRELWKRSLEYYLPDYKPCKGMVRRIEGKVAILVPNFLGPDHAPAMIYRMMANTLIHMGKQVKIFVISEYAGEKSFGFLSLQKGLTEQELGAWDEYNRKMLDKEVEIEYIAENDISGLLGKAIHEVFEFCPQYVIDATNERSPISGILYKYFPVLCYTTTAGTSGTFFTKTTAAVFEYNEEIAPYQVTLPYFLMTKEESESYNKGERLGIPENSFVIVTVGRRLYSEMDQDLVDCVDEMLKRNPDMHWLLVGNTEVEKYFDGKETIDRIRIIPYENDLSALYRLCDVYLNPDRMGGGFSMMFAMQQGVAVAALKKNYCGGSGGVRWLGEDEAIDGYNAELCKYIENLYKCPDLLEEKKRVMQKIIQKKCSTVRWCSALCDALDEMERCFEQVDSNSFLS